MVQGWHLLVRLTKETDVVRSFLAIEAFCVSLILTCKVAWKGSGFVLLGMNLGGSTRVAFAQSGCRLRHVVAASAMTGRPLVVMVGTALNFRMEWVVQSKTWTASVFVLKPLRTLRRANMLICSLTTWSKTMVMCRRTPCRISVIWPDSSSFLR